MAASAVGAITRIVSANIRSVTSSRAPVIETATHARPASVNRFATVTRCSLSPRRNRILWKAVGAISRTAAAPAALSAPLVVHFGSRGSNRTV